MLMTLVAGLARDSSHVPALFSAWQKRVNQSSGVNSGLSGEEVFANASSMMVIDEAWKFDFIASRCPLTVEKLALCKVYDDDSATNFITFRDWPPFGHEITRRV